MELRVLIPTISVLGVLLLATVVLLVIITVRIHKRRRKVREWQQHGIVEDNYSIAWSQEGLTRGVSVREGKLVRHHSRHKSKDGSKVPTVDVKSVQDDLDAYSVMRDMGSLEYMNSISNITSSIGPSVGRALSVGSHKASIMSSEKSRQISPMPTTREEGQIAPVSQLDSQRRPSSSRSGRKKSSHSSNSSRSNFHDTQVPEDITLQGRDSILLPSPPSSVHIYTPTHSRHSRQSPSSSSFTYTPVTPRGSISLFPLTAPPGQRRRPSAAAQAATANLANNIYPHPQYSVRRPSFLQNSFSHDQLTTLPNASFDHPPTTLATFADELTPRPSSAGRPKVSRIHIPNPQPPASPRALVASTNESLSPSSPDNASGVHTQNENFQNWTFPGSTSTNGSASNPELSHFPTPYNEVPRPQYGRAPSSAVGLSAVGIQTNISASRKESFVQYAQSRRESFGGPGHMRRESHPHGPSGLRRDSTASFLGTPPKFATGPRVYQQAQVQPVALPPPRETITRSYSDRSMHSTYNVTPNERSLDPMNIISSVNESKSSIVSISSTGSASSYYANVGLSPPPLQKASFEGTRPEVGSIDFAFNSSAATRIQQPNKPPVTPPRHAHGKPFGVGQDSYSFENSPPHRRLGKGFVPETVDESNESLPASPASTITVTDRSGEGQSPIVSNGDKNLRR